MKNLKVFFGMFVMLILLITSCTEDEGIEKQELSIEEIMEQEYKAYKKEFPNARIEYATLEELNKALVAEGLDAYTKEDFTDDEWELLQNPDRFAQIRCTSGFAVTMGDMNGDGTFSTADLVQAQATINGVPPGTGFYPLVWNAPPQVQKYGWFDQSYRNFPYAPQPPEVFFLDGDDILVSRRVILGIYPC